jgi:hypothetical protein
MLQHESKKKSVGKKRNTTICRQFTYPHTLPTGSADRQSLTWYWDEQHNVNSSACHFHHKLNELSFVLVLKVSCAQRSEGGGGQNKESSCEWLANQDSIVWFNGCLNLVLWFEGTANNVNSRRQTSYLYTLKWVTDLPSLSIVTSLKPIHYIG